MWFVTAFGVFFGLSGIVGFTLPEPDPGGAITTMLGGAVFAAMGVMSARSRVELRDDYLLSRNIVRARRIQRDDIVSVEVAESAMSSSPFQVDSLLLHTTALHNDWAALRLHRPQYSLQPLNRFHTRRGHAVLRSQQRAIDRWLGNGASDEPV